MLVLVLGGARSGKSAYAESIALAHDAQVSTMRKPGDTQTGEHAAAQRKHKQHEKLVYIATGVITDVEMARRITHHQARRGDFWRTVEAPHDLPQALKREAAEAALLPHGAVVLVDCLTVWMTNVFISLEELPKDGPVTPDTPGQKDIQGTGAISQNIPDIGEATAATDIETAEQYIEALCAILESLSKGNSKVIMVAQETGLGIVPQTSTGRRFRDLAGTMNQKVAQLADEVYFVAAGLPIVLKGGNGA